MCESSNNQEKFQELDSFISALSTKEGSLITVLHRAQDIFGYLPEEVQMYVAKKLSIPTSKVFGVVTFYSFFNTTPKGKIRVNVCTGTACFVRGAEHVLDEIKKHVNVAVGETSADGIFSLDCLRCVGACGLAPVISINGKVYGRVTPEDVKGIIEEQLAKEQVYEESVAQ